MVLRRTALDHVQLALHIESTETRVVKMFPTEASRDVGMVLCLSNTSLPAWKKQLAEKCQEQGGVPFHATNHAEQHSLASEHFGYAFTILTTSTVIFRNGLSGIRECYLVILGKPLAEGLLLKVPSKAKQAQMIVVQWVGVMVVTYP